MGGSLDVIFFIIAAISLFSLLLVSLIIINKYSHKAQLNKIQKMDQYIIEGILAATDFSLRNRSDIGLFIERFGELKQLLTLSPSAVKNFYDVVSNYKVINHFASRTRSLFKHRRIEAAVYLGIIGNDESRQVLELALKNESDYSVKLYIINALVDIGHTESIGKIVGTTVSAPHWYCDKAQALVFEYGYEFYAYLTSRSDTDSLAVKELLVNFAARMPLGELRPHLRKIIDNPSDQIELVHKVVKALAKISPAEMDCSHYLQHTDAFIRAVAIEALSHNPTENNVIRLMAMLADETNQKPTILAISHMLIEQPQLFRLLTTRFLTETDPTVKTSLAEILGNRIEYLLLKLNGKDRLAIRTIVKEVMLMGKNSNIIGFLNKNRNIELENEIISLLKITLCEKTELQPEFCAYLDDRVLKKCNLSYAVATGAKKEEIKDRKVIVLLYALVAGIFLIFPSAYLLRHYDILLTTPLIEQIKLYIVDFNYYLIYYASSVNGIYLLILFFSFLGVAQQSRYWQLKKITFLFKKGIMPSISIIAPAFNEEATIIESANSLMNLKYPDYELIIVNDGSKDNTLQTLIQYFNLEKVDIEVVEQLTTKPIRGIYRSKSMPKLTVVDKENGGKADSLNTGINISTKDYFCGIDADSLLETEALLKLTSQMVDQTVECPAMGGNIFPINGCSVDKGLLLNLQIPKNHIARLQTIEYIRAFMAGRVGWAYLDCLLIISGAFGLFKKDRIIEIGGYLTSSGKYRKDTVGEDMELVVRLSKHMLESNIKFKINYAFNANCWTEVPESYSVLKRQRDRWHRGLIDILTFHRNMLGNVRYGKVGLVALPYFFIFEMMGPLIEIQGYIMIILAALLGLLNVNMALLLFIATILLGILISLASLYLAEKETDYFSLREVSILILYAFLENFGPRQLISLWRVNGYINSLKKPKGWGKMERKGFSSPSR